MDKTEQFVTWWNQSDDFLSSTGAPRAPPEKAEGSSWFVLGFFLAIIITLLQSFSVNKLSTAPQRDAVGHQIQ